MTDISKIAIVGAATIRGKELNEALAASSFASATLSLMDEESQIGQLEAVGDEVTFIQRIEPSAFDGMDYVFFAGSEGMTRKHWKAAHKAGASIVDLSFALENEPGVLVRAPWLDKTRLNLNTPAIVPAHPLAVALALLIARLRTLAAITSASATVLEPASEYGHAALDELHQQTIGLLNFQTLPKVVYDTQIAFNIAPVLGPQAKIDLRGNEARIRRHYRLLAGDALPQVAVQLLQAPVFHGHGISLAVEFNKPLPLEQVEAALGAEHIDLVMGDGDADVPNNLNTVGESDVMVRVRRADDTEAETTRFWLWASIDNLKFAALNAVACAQELRKVRPQGKVQ
ncbi:MAG: Asd/ArgC dimerization domain-containing protein [Acidobacteriaceae bacterium]